MTAKVLGWTIVPVMLAAVAFASSDFTLDDQFERPHRRADVFKDGPVVIIAGAQRKTPDSMQSWERTLRSQAPAGTRIYGLSNLKKLPFFVPKGAVRKDLQEKLPKTPVLCDWKGKVYADLGFPKDATIAVGVFADTGERLGIVAGEQTPARVGDVLRLIGD